MRSSRAGKALTYMAAFLMAAAMLLLSSDPVFADTSDSVTSKDYKYRYDLSAGNTGLDGCTKLGIVLFPGDTLSDISENREEITNGCKNLTKYPGFKESDDIDSLFNVQKRQTTFNTDEGEQSAEGIAFLTLKSDKPVAVDGGDIVTEGPYKVMSNGIQVEHTTVLYKKIRVRELGPYTVIYDLDGGEWNNGTNPNEDSFQPEKEDREYALQSEVPVKRGYKFVGWTPDSRTGAIDLQGSQESGYKLVVKGLFSDDETTMQGKLNQANALYNNAGYTLKADWEEKADNTLNIKAKTTAVTYSKLKNKTQTLVIGKVVTFKDKGQGKLTYAKLSGNKKITVNKKTGKLTIGKGLRKNTYKVKIKVTAAGGNDYNSVSKTVTVKIRVK